MLLVGALVSWLLLLVTTASSMSLPSAQDPTASRHGLLDETLQLLSDGDKHLQFVDKQDVVLVMGNVGSGKTTLVKFLAGDAEDLVAVENEMGEFIIEDTKAKSSDIVSNTIYPELIVDVKTNTTYIDFPGFSDKRNSSYDIAGAFLIKRVLEKADRVKLLFTVSHESVKSDADKQDFNTLLKHANNFIKNFDHIKGSIGLVVTKVDNTQGRMPLINDTQIKSGIATFLELLKEELKKSSSDDKSLIEIFLSRSGDGLNKVVLFRSPDEPGPLSESKSLHDGKKSLENLVQNSLTFGSIADHDFGFTLSSETARNETAVFVEEINKELLQGVGGVVEQIRKHLLDIESSKSVEVVELLEHFLEVERVISTLQINTDNSSKLMFRTLENIVEKCNVFVSEDQIGTISKYSEYIDFMQELSEFGGIPFDWEEQFNKINQYLKDSINWYSFLNLLSSKLSEFEIQKDTSKYNVADMKDWGKTGKRQGILITAGNLKQFLSKVDSMLPSNERFEGADVDDFKLSVLNDILNVTLKQKINIQHVDHTLKVTGNLIKLSDVSKELISLKSEGKTIKFVEIFALNTVFIDADLMLKGTMTQVFISGHKWDVQGNRSIVLDGEDGSSKGRANDGASSGVSGEDGFQGHSGGDAGTFFGLAQRVMHGQQLTVTANGGKGGPGQDGGHGAEGRAGKDPVVPSYDSKKYMLMPKIFAGSVWKYEYNYSAPDKNGELENFYALYGTKGSKGGDGGSGGMGGLGGRAGSVQIAGLPSDAGIDMSSVTGQSGSSGNGGNGGLGGKNGVTEKVRHKASPSGTELFVMDKLDTGRAESGYDGESGKIVNPKSLDKIYFRNNLQVISNFKSYLREHF